MHVVNSLKLHEQYVLVPHVPAASSASCVGEGGTLTPFESLHGLSLKVAGNTGEHRGWGTWESNVGREAPPTPERRQAR